MTGGRVFVTGGNGVVGRAVLNKLVAEHRSVLALARSDASRHVVEQSGATAVPGDVRDKASLVAGMKGCDVAYHLAGANVLCLRDPSLLFEVNVVGSRNVVEAAAESGISRVVYTSSAATIGEQRGEVGREDTAHRGWFLSNYERSKFEAEEAVLERARALDVDVVCINPASVQGPGRSGGTTRLLISFLTGRLRVVVPTCISLVDIDDCAQGHVLAEGQGRPGERYILSGASLSVEEALAVMTRVTGMRRRPLSIPAAAAVTAATVAEAAGRIRGRKPALCREVARTLVHGHVYDGSRAQRELGLRYTPVEDTLRRTVAWLVDQQLVPAAVMAGPVG